MPNTSRHWLHQPFFEFHLVTLPLTPPSVSAVPQPSSSIYLPFTTSVEWAKLQSNSVLPELIMPLVVSQVRVPSLASLYYQDNRLPDAGGDYTRISRPRMHPWTRKEKQILYILSKFYKNEAVELWGVFLAFFSDIYRRSSRPRRSAWNSMRLYNLHPARFAVWWSAATTTRLKAQVEEQALRICTPLRPVQGGDQQATAPRKRKPPHYSSSSSNSEDEWDWDTTKDTDHESRRDQMIKKDPKSIQTPRSKFITSVGGLPTPPSSQRVSRRVRPAWIVRPSIPPIAFRGKR